MIALSPISVVYPGPVKTPMEAAGRAAYEESWAVRLLMAPGEASVLARLVADAVEGKEARVIYPFFNAVGRHFPAITRVFLDAFTPKVRSPP